MSWTNYHSHTCFCDGKGHPYEFVEEAIKQGMPAYGITTHSPIAPHRSGWNVDLEELPAYIGEVNQTKEKYKDRIEVYLGLEVDYIPGVVGPKSDFCKELDFVVGSVHYIDFFNDGKPWEIDGSPKVFKAGFEEIFQLDAQRVAERFYELTRMMLQDECPDVLGHMDKLKMQNVDGVLFNERDEWYRKQVLATLEVARSKDVIIEINTRGFYQKRIADFYPSNWILEAMHDMGIRVQVNSDSHRPREISDGFTEAATVLRAIGFKELTVLLGGQWQPRPFTEQGIVF